MTILISTSFKLKLSADSNLRIVINKPTFSCRLKIILEKGDHASHKHTLHPKCFQKVPLSRLLKVGIVKRVNTVCKFHPSQKNGMC